MLPELLSFAVREVDTLREGHRTDLDGKGAITLWVFS